MPQEIERRVEQAYVEKRSTLTGSLEWAQKKFSNAARLVSYSKCPMYWSAITAVFYPVRVPGFAGRLLIVLMIGFGAYLLAILYETYRLLEVNEQQLKLAERVARIAGAEIKFDEERHKQLSGEYHKTIRFNRRPIMRFHWGSTEKLGWLWRAVWPSRSNPGWLPTND